MSDQRKEVSLTEETFRPEDRIREKTRRLHGFNSGKINGNETVEQI